MGQIYDPSNPSNNQNPPGGQGQIQGPGVPAGSVVRYLPDGETVYEAPNGDVYTLSGKLLGNVNTSATPPPNGPPGTGPGGGGGASGTVVTTADGEKLTQAQYDATAAGYRHWARTYGFTISDAQIRHNIVGGVSVSEMAQRFEVEHLLDKNATVLAEFASEAKREGLVNHVMDSNDLRSFILKEAPASWNNLWQMAMVRGAAAEAGLQIGRGKGDLFLTRGQVKEIIGGVGLSGQAPGTDLLSGLTNQIGQYRSMVLQALPAARFRGYNLNKDDLIKGVFAGDASALETADRIIKAEAAKYAGPAQPQLVSTGQGTFTTTGAMGIAAPQGQ